MFLKHESCWIHLSVKIIANVHLVLTAKLSSALDICWLGFLNGPCSCSTQLLPSLYCIYLNTVPVRQVFSILWPFKTCLFCCFFSMLSLWASVLRSLGHRQTTPQKPRGTDRTHDLPNNEQAFIPYSLRCSLQSLQLNKRGCYERTDSWSFIRLSSRRLCHFLLTRSSSRINSNNKSRHLLLMYATCYFPEWRFRWRRPLCYQ